MGANFSQFLTSLDIFGHPITVNFRGEGTFKTRLGAFMTLCVFALMIFNLVNLSAAFIDGSKLEEKTNITLYDRYDSPKLDLQQNGIELSLYATSVVT